MFEFIVPVTGRNIHHKSAYINKSQPEYKFISSNEGHNKNRAGRSTVDRHGDTQTQSWKK